MEYIKYFEEMNLNFFKKKSSEDYQYVAVQDYLVKYANDNYLRATTIDDFRELIFSFFRDFMIGKNIKIECTKIQKPYVYKGIGNVKKGKFIDGTFEFKLKNIEKIGERSLALYDDEYKYITEYFKCARSKIRMTMNRKISKLDPYGEENWDDN